MAEKAEKGSDNSFDFTSLGSFPLGTVSCYSERIFVTAQIIKKNKFILKKIQLLCMQQSRTISHKQFI